MMSSKVEVVIVWQERMNRSQNDSLLFWELNITAWLKHDLSSHHFFAFALKKKKKTWTKTFLPHKNLRNEYRCGYACMTTAEAMQCVWMSECVLKCLAVHLWILTFGHFVFELQRDWTGQTFSFTCAWPTFLVHCNSMWFVNSLHCRIMKYTQTAQWWVHRETLSTILHTSSKTLQRDQLFHTLKSKGTVYNSSFLEVGSQIFFIYFFGLDFQENRECSQNFC